jgi:glycosyltransferase involved in cell wall biosynthesis
MTEPKRKRVLFLVPSFTGGGGGAERLVANVLRHLDHSRFDCHLALAQSSAACLENLPTSVRLHCLGVARMRYALPGIVRLVRRVKPQTILSTASHLNMLLIMAKPFLPAGTRLLLSEVTTPTAFVAKDTQHPRLWRWLYRSIYPRADKVICLSDSILKELVEEFNVPWEKLVRIYSPVDVEWMRQLAETAGNPFYDSGPHLVAAGRLRREKGFDLLLEAMPAVLLQFPTARLAILGEGPLEAELREQARRLGVAESVEFSGYRQDPWSYFKHADLFLLPSRFEGLPNVVLEALALGTTVVAFDCVGGMREIQESCERLVLVAPENPGALADAVITALNKPHTTTYQTDPLFGRFNLQETMAAYSELL